MCSDNSGGCDLNVSSEAGGIGAHGAAWLRWQVERLGGNAGVQHARASPRPAAHRPAGPGDAAKAGLQLRLCHAPAPHLLPPRLPASRLCGVALAHTHRARPWISSSTPRTGSNSTKTGPRHGNTRIRMERASSNRGRRGSPRPYICICTPKDKEEEKKKTPAAEEDSTAAKV